MLLGNERGIIEFSLQKWLRERATMLRYMYLLSLFLNKTSITMSQLRDRLPGLSAQNIRLTFFLCNTSTWFLALCTFFPFGFVMSAEVSDVTPA
jgi:hypothetical protein